MDERLSPVRKSTGAFVLSVAVLASTKRFTCAQCQFTAIYEYFGKTPKYSPRLMSVYISNPSPTFTDEAFSFLEDTYTVRDPFSPPDDIQRCIGLGSHCAVCNRTVCISTNCSLFYTRRFCRDCFLAHKAIFPEQLQQVGRSLYYCIFCRSLSFYQQLSFVNKRPS